MTLPTNLGMYSKKLCEIEQLRKNWGWLMLLGSAFVLLGVLAIATSVIATVVSVIFLGSLLLFQQFPLATEQQNA